MAVTKNTVWYTNFGNGSSTGYYAVAAWATGTTETVGNIVRQLTTPTVGNERCFVCIVAGTTNATTEPTWVVTKGAKTTDNTVTWMECTGLPALNADNANTPLSSANRSGAQVLGNLIQNNTQDHYFICTTAGTTGAGEPTYNTTTGATTTDGGCTWTCLGAVTSFTTKWGAPHNRVANAIATNWGTNGDTHYVSSAHAETQAAALTWNTGSVLVKPTEIICVGNAGNIPPQAADVTTGASVTTTSANSMTIGSAVDIWGIAFSCGSGANIATLSLGTAANSNVRLHNCSLTLPGTSTEALSLASTTGFVALRNTNFSVSGNTSSGITSNGPWTWRESSWTSTGTLTNIINGGAAHGATLCEDIDLSGVTVTNIVNNGGSGRHVFSRCKMPASYTGQTTANPVPGFPTLDLINCDSGGNTYKHERWSPVGTQQTETTAIHTNGASDGTTGYSWKLSGFEGFWSCPFESMPAVIWNTTTGTNVTATLEACVNLSALPNNDDIWLECEYFGTSGSTNGSRVTQGKANPVAAGSALPASTVAWDSQAAARANTTAYVAGNFIKVASNPGRLFICTSPGTSAGAEPAGYASAVDGSIITDGSATFQAMMRFKLQVVLTSPTPQAVGYVYAYIKGVKVSTTFYVDPLITLT